MKVILGSSSLGRKQILAKAGLKFEVIAPDIDERAIRDGDPRILTQALAGAKAIAIAAKCGVEPAVIITADQVAVYRDEIREKPATKDEAIRWLSQYDATAPVEFITTIFVSRVGGEYATQQQTHRSVLWYDRLPPLIIRRLVDIGTVMQSCGACALEDPLIAHYICSIDGEGTNRNIHTSIIGLPIDTTLAMLARFDIRP